MFYAHSADEKAHWEPLRDHLRLVACRAACFAKIFGAATEAEVAGLLHDIGKYAELFHLRLEGQASGLDHWSLGAWIAHRHFDEAGSVPALAIQGHHIGLQVDCPSRLEDLEPEKLSKRVKGLTEKRSDLLLERFADDGLELPELDRSVFDPDAPPVSRMLDVRMLFSTLVDADHLETEAHFRGQAEGKRIYREPGPSLDPERAIRLLDQEVAKLAASSDASPHVLSMCEDLRRVCEERATLTPGLFTLTAPTGTGKTLALLAFALRHAREHGLRRIVLAIPYLTILDQTAKVYRDLFEKALGEEVVLEHHSLANGPAETGDRAEKDPEADEIAERRRRARELTQNWDAPIVLTTNVQLLESLFSNRPRACRKLHRLAKSVVLFDEVQTLPPKLAVPTLGALSHLAERYGSSVVFATATQPAFGMLDPEVRKLAGGWQPREIVDPKLDLFARAKRVEVAWDLERPISWEELADELLAKETPDQVLCIVNLKRHARALAQALQAHDAEGLLHLSTNLCPAHRERVLAEVHRRLKDGLPCRLISTQCVEAGVDVDFPQVWRAFGPLDSIAQAAGRANRRGGLPGLGVLRVFLPEDEAYPPRAYTAAVQATWGMYRELGPEGLQLEDPEIYRRFYARLYTGTQIHSARTDLREALEDFDFPTVATQYRLIDKDAIQVVVPYAAPGTPKADAPNVLATLRAALDGRRGLTAEWIRRARPYTVNLYRPAQRAAVWSFLDPAVPASTRGEAQRRDDWFFLLGEAYDSELLGLCEAEEAWIA